jgi:cytochrome c oxidase cbb3-type subunit 3
MSSVSKIARRLSFALVACAVATAACQGTRGTAAPNSAPPPMQTAVGPIPGPGDDGPSAPNPYAGDRTGMGEGHLLYNRFNCAGCHGDHAGGGMGPSLRDVDWRYGASDAQIFNSIAVGRAYGMPAWGTRLNDDQIWKLVAYIKTLRTPNEIAPPT